MQPHRLFSQRGVAFGNGHHDLAMIGGISGLIVDAMGGLASVPPCSFQRRFQHRIEDGDQQRIARGG